MAKKRKPFGKLFWKEFFPLLWTECLEQLRKIPKWVFCVVIFLTISYFLIVHIEPSSIGISRNFITGHMERLDAGWHLTTPWTGVAHIDCRPTKVDIGTTSRAHSSKLVQFNPDEWETFVNTEGWRWYWWDNRISINFGFGVGECRGMDNILRAYAYCNKRYSFIKILNEY